MAGQGQPDDWFGRALTTGDFDGNGYPDLAVSVPGETIDGMSNAGAMQVLYARSTGITVEGNQLWSQGRWHSRRSAGRRSIWLCARRQRFQR
jgi:hypothetical protein